MSGDVLANIDASKITLISFLDYSITKTTGMLKYLTNFKSSAEFLKVASLDLYYL